MTLKKGITFRETKIKQENLNLPILKIEDCDEDGEKTKPASNGRR